MRKKPDILSVKEVARSRIFCVQELKLRFNNGVERTYERLQAGGSGAVMIVALDSSNNVLMIREYCAGVDNYELALPKGLVEKGEPILEAANRELKEEVGVGAKELIEIKKITLAPGYLSHKMSIVLARNLFDEKLEGDEPEPIDVIPVPFHEFKSLLHQDDFTEARSIAALFLVEEFLKNEKNQIKKS